MARSPINREDFGDDDDLGVDEILAADEQEKRHAADPSQPRYLPADEPGFETEAYTAGGPEEEDA